MKFDGYDCEGFFDEMFEADGTPRGAAVRLIDRINSLPDGDLKRRQRAAEQVLLHMGITFTVYGDEAGTERIFPFDVIPRIIDAAEWVGIERGLKQRVNGRDGLDENIQYDQFEFRIMLKKSDKILYKSNTIGKEFARLMIRVANTGESCRATWEEAMRLSTPEPRSIAIACKRWFTNRT